MVFIRPAVCPKSSRTIQILLNRHTSDKPMFLPENISAIKARPRNKAELKKRGISYHPKIQNMFKKSELDRKQCEKIGLL